MHDTLAAKARTSRPRRRYHDTPIASASPQTGTHTAQGCTRRYRHTLDRYASALNTDLPAYFACSPSCCSMRSSWLYLAVRSERANDPVFIWPQLVATARSAMVESSVSPERCDITEV